MKILVITDKLYPDEQGGSCIVAYKLIKEWEKENEVTTCTCYPEKQLNDNNFRGRVIRCLNKKNIIGSGLNLSRELNNNNYDIIVTHSTISWLVLKVASFFTKISKKKVYSVYHGPWYKEAALKYLGTEQHIKKMLVVPCMKMLERYYEKNIVNVIFLSQYMRLQFSELCNLSSKKISIIPGGVDRKMYTRKMSKDCARKKLNLPADKYIIFTLRRLDKRMGLDRLIESIKLLDNRIKDNVLLIIGGKGEYKNKLEQYAESVKKQVVFPGYISSDDVNTYFCAADLFVVPTLDLEGFGLVNLESLSMGVPVLATPQGGMIELANCFDNMFLTPENSIKGIVQGIEKRFYDNKGVINEKNIDEYSWTNIANKYLILFKKQSEVDTIG